MACLPKRLAPAALLPTAATARAAEARTAVYVAFAAARPRCRIVRSTIDQRVTTIYPGPPVHTTREALFGRYTAPPALLHTPRAQSFADCLRWTRNLNRPHLPDAPRASSRAHGPDVRLPKHGHTRHLMPLTACAPCAARLPTMATARAAASEALPALRCPRSSILRRSPRPCHTPCAHALCLLCCCVLPVLLPPVITCTRTAPLPLRPGRFAAVSAAATAATVASQALLTLSV